MKIFRRKQQATTEQHSFTLGEIMTVELYENASGLSKSQVMKEIESPTGRLPEDAYAGLKELTLPEMSLEELQALAQKLGPDGASAHMKSVILQNNPKVRHAVEELQRA